MVGRLLSSLVLITLHSEWKYENIVDYYEKLIVENRENGLNYPVRFPENNYEFWGYTWNSIVHDYGKFDFIIVGAGSTGAVIATRLSEVKRFKILLLEAGGEEDEFSDIPAMAPYLQFSKMNWGYYTTPQRTCCQGMVNNSCAYPMGRVIGGSSTIGNLIYSRGNGLDFDNWEKVGNPGWSFKDLLPYFKKSEDSLVNGDNGYHETGGLWRVDYSNWNPWHYKTFYEGIEAIGLKNIDINGRNQIGFSRTPYNIKYGQRQSTGRAFLDKAKYRKNLNLFSNAYVSKILINGNSSKAIGVQFVKGGKKYKAFSNSEVILSAGAINSPQLLMLAGIGPKKELEKLNIHVIKDAPTGKHLKDHVTFYGLAFSTNTTHKMSFHDELKQYIHGEGPFTSAGGEEIIGFLNTQNDSSAIPDVEFKFISLNVTKRLTGKLLNLNRVLTDYIENLNPLTDFRVELTLLYPESEGQITLTENDPAQYPNIDINYFSDNNNLDLERLYKAVEIVMDLVKTETFKRIDTKFIPIPVCKEFDPDTRDYWYCAVRQLSTSAHDPVGTARMGPEGDAVVDYELKVYGVKNLRVADCSIFPTVTSGRTNAAAVMIGEKVSDIIKQKYLFVTY